jgi:hypothetical protein
MTLYSEKIYIYLQIGFLFAGQGYENYLYS